MLHGFAFLLFAAELVWLASGLPPTAAAVFGYGALSFTLVAVAYFTQRPEMLGKREDGEFAPLYLILLAPFHLVCGLSALLRRLRPTAPWHEVTDGVWLGERTNDVPPGTRRIVDLTVEHRRIGPRDVDYLLVATLDGQAPDRSWVKHIVDQMVDDPQQTYVHCFAGRGRSATVVAAYLLTAEIVETAEEAVKFMQERRPVVRLGSEQLALARTFERQT